MSDERKLNIGTLLIAALASAAAAIIVSQFWIAGTPIAAAVTPVIVALVSELLHRPASKVAERLTTDRAALAEPEPTAQPEPVERVPRPVSRDPEVRVYKPGRRGRIAWGIVLTTAVLAFGIGALALTLPELIAGESIGKGQGTSTFLGNDKKKSDDASAEPQGTTEQEEEPAPDEQTTETPPATEEETTPEETTTTPPPATTPSTTTEPAP